MNDNFLFPIFHKWSLKREKKNKETFSIKTKSALRTSIENLSSYIEIFVIRSIYLYKKYLNYQLHKSQIEK